MDSEEILKSYLLDKGALDVAGRNLLEILKELLRKENNGIQSLRVEECQYITVEELSLGSISLGNLDHFARVEPREPLSPSGQSLITGVVVRTTYNDRLVDGYHRLKNSLDSGLEKGSFVVISAMKL